MRTPPTRGGAALAHPVPSRRVPSRERGGALTAGAEGGRSRGLPGPSGALGTSRDVRRRRGRCSRTAPPARPLAGARHRPPAASAHRRRAPPGRARARPPRAAEGRPPLPYMGRGRGWGRAGPAPAPAVLPPCSPRTHFPRYTRLPRYPPLSPVIPRRVAAGVWRQVEPRPARASCASPSPHSEGTDVPCVLPGQGWERMAAHGAGVVDVNANRVKDWVAAGVQ